MFLQEIWTKSPKLKILVDFSSIYKYLQRTNNGIPLLFSRGAVRMTGAETKKDINNLSDYQCLTFNLGVFALRKSGAEDN